MQPEVSSRLLSTVLMQSSCLLFNSTNPFSQKFTDFCFLCMNVLPMGMDMNHVYVVPTKASNPLDLELVMAVSHHVGGGN